METVHHLSLAIGPRPAGSDSEQLAATWLADQLAAAGYTVEIDTFPVPGRGVSRNVIGTMGASPRRLIGAHYDTKKRSPGADDNASGCAVILEFARRRARSGEPLAFVFFGAEEMQTMRFQDHHYGSRHLAARLPAGMIEDVTIVDMIGMGKDLRVRSLTINGQVERMLLAARRINKNALYMPDRSGLSDHESFERRGYHAAWLERRPSPFYHSPQDRVVRQEYLDEAIRILEETFPGKD